MDQKSRLAMCASKFEVLACSLVALLQGDKHDNEAGKEEKGGKRGEKSERGEGSERGERGGMDKGVSEEKGERGVAGVYEAEGGASLSSEVVSSDTDGE